MPEKQSENQQNQRGSSSNQQMARTSQSGGVQRGGLDPFFLSPREFFSANPFSLMRRMSEEMDRVFSEFGMQRSGGSGGGQMGAMWAPPIEVAERGGNLVVHAELPGLKPEDVKVEVNNEALIIQGERKFEQQQNEGGIHRTERRYGQFYRTVPLPENVNPEQVRARFENGVLEVTVPVPQAQSNSRQIPIEAASSGANAGSSTATAAGAGSQASTAGSSQTAKA
jgi:HSP20 family protein